MKTDGLEQAIEQVEAGNFLILLDGKGGKEKLAGWLKELHELRDANAKRRRAETMDTLTGFSGLSQQEAEQLMAYLDAGGKLEYEEGPCRRCKGRRKVVAYVRGGCFGSEDFEEDCPTCCGTGTDTHRIKLPEAVSGP